MLDWTKGRGGNVDILMYAIADNLEEFPLHLWPPTIPGYKWLAEKTALSPRVLRRVIEAELADGVFLSRHKGSLVLTVEGLAWLRYRGRLAQFVKPSDKGYGVAIPKLEILYPT